MEDSSPPDAGLKHPVCLTGTNACLPEDCGDTVGHQRLPVGVADPKHEECEVLKK